MRESGVKKFLYDFLQMRHSVVLEEFNLPIGGRIDYLSFDWEDEYEIGIRGFECKGSPFLASVARILREQISDYQNVVPKVYLVLSSKKLKDLQYLCSLNGVGLVNVNENGEINIVKDSPKPPQPLLKNDYFEPLRALAAMFLTFKESFGENLRQGYNWCSTPEKNTEVQFNTWYSYNTGYVNFSVNLENSRKVMKRIDLKHLQTELFSLPSNYWVRAWLENYYAPRRRVRVSLFKREPSQVNLEDLEYLKRRSAKELVHFQIATHLWSYDELLPKRVHEDRLNSTRKNLSSIHHVMST